MVATLGLVVWIAVRFFRVLAPDCGAKRFISFRSFQCLPVLLNHREHSAILIEKHAQVNVRQPLMLLPPPVAAVEHQVCMRKLTPMPRDLPPSHQAKTVDVLIFLYAFITFA